MEALQICNICLASAGAEDDSCSSFVMFAVRPFRESVSASRPASVIRARDLDRLASGDGALGLRGRESSAHQLNRLRDCEAMRDRVGSKCLVIAYVSLALLPLLARRWRFRCRRVGRIPAPGGGPVGRPGKWIRVAKSPKAPHRGHAFL